MTEIKTLDDGVTSFTVSNGKISFTAMDWGCTITNLYVPSKTGEKIDILLGFDTLEGWKAGTASHNAIVGRFANRIRGAKFTLDGKEYILDKNDGNNCLHGGNTRYEKQLWKGEKYSDSEGEGVKFTRKSPDGEQGFPGNVELSVIYKLTDKNEFVWEYTATSDKATPINLTNHAYFNLDGKGNIKKHLLQLDSKEILETGSDSAPTGKILPVAGTVFDFNKEKVLGTDLEKVEPLHNGYDLCFLTGGDETGLVRIGKIRSEESGISMEMFTNQCGVHVYTGNYLAGTVGKGGVVHNAHDGVCFETERFPNAINEPSFPSCVLKPGEKYFHKMVLKF